MLAAMTGRRIAGSVRALAATVALAVAAAPASALNDPETELPAPDVLPDPGDSLADPPDEGDLPEAPGGAGVDSLLDELGAVERESDAKRLEQRILRAWHRSGSATVDLLIRRANAAIKDEDYALALEYLDTIVVLAPDFAEGWNKRATVYYLIDEYQRAIADIGRVLALEPRHFGALGGLGMIFRELNDRERALSAFRRALDVHPFFGDIRSAAERLEVEVEGRGI